MGNELIKVTPSLDISLTYPSNIPASILRSLIIPQTVQMAVELVRGGVIVGGGIVGAVVEVVEQTRVRIALYRECSRLLIEDIIPIEALYAVHQHARDASNHMGLDPDLRAKMQTDLNEKLEWRRSKL